MHPVICILGRKDTGKTGLTEKIIRDLINRKYRVASAKHTSHPLEFDEPGTDSFRFQKAGSNPVLLVSSKGSALYFSNEPSWFSTEKLEELIGTSVDVVLLEGFSDWVRDDGKVGKIVCYTKKEQVEEYSNILAPPILGFYSYLADEGEQFSDLMNKVYGYIEEFKSVEKIYGRLPKLDCSECGYKNCFEMANHIFQGKQSYNSCTVLSKSEASSVEIRINGEKLPLKPFPAKIIKNAVIGLVSSLKQVDEKIYGNIKVSIEKG